MEAEQLKTGRQRQLRTETIDKMCLLVITVNFPHPRTIRDESLNEDYLVQYPICTSPGVGSGKVS